MQLRSTDHCINGTPTPAHRRRTGHDITSHHITSHDITSHHITSHHITSHDITSHHITSHHITSHDITSHHITSHHITSHHITSHHITSHHITSHHITSHHITSHHITSHHITSHDITSHHITQMRFFYSKTTSAGVLNHYATNGGGQSEVSRSQPGQPPVSARSTSDGTTSGPSPQKNRSSTDQSGQRSSTAAVVATDTLVSSPSHNTTHNSPHPTPPTPYTHNSHPSIIALRPINTSLGIS